MGSSAKANTSKKHQKGNKIYYTGKTIISEDLDSIMQEYDIHRKLEMLSKKSNLKRRKTAALNSSAAKYDNKQAPFMKSPIFLKRSLTSDQLSPYFAHNCFIQDNHSPFCFIYLSIALITYIFILLAYPERLRAQTHNNFKTTSLSSQLPILQQLRFYQVQFLLLKLIALLLLLTNHLNLATQIIQETTILFCHLLILLKHRR